MGDDLPVIIEALLGAVSWNIGCLIYTWKWVALGQVLAQLKCLIQKLDAG